MLAHPLWCQECVRLRDFEVNDNGINVKATCEAYPKGIPEAVIYAGHVYQKPNDNGLQFKCKSKTIPDYLQQTKKEEETNYREYAEFFEELNMTEEEFRAKMKKLHGDDGILYKKPTLETEPRIW